MKDDEKEIDPRESLKLITSMIESAKHSISDQSHFYLLWGWAVMVGCFLQFFLKTILDYPKHYYAWFVTPVAIIFHFYFLSRQRNREHVKTFVGEANKYLWSAICMAFVVLALIFTKIGWQYSFPFFILFYGIGTYVSGSLLQFKPLIVGGIAAIVIASFTAFLPYDYQILITAFSILISYVIPGYMLRTNYTKNKQF